MRLTETRTLQGGVCIRWYVGRLPHDRAHRLCEPGIPKIPTKLFQESIARWLNAHISDDMASDEGTGEVVEAVAYSKRDGVVCGKFPIDELIRDYFPSCKVSWFVEEGERVSEGNGILSLTGPSASVLSCERVLLNILGRMSGIATLTSEWVSTAEGIRIACTRKTAWGLMDKWAVHVGGGLTHRLSREDALMIKENDLAIIEPNGDSQSCIPSVIASIDFDSNAKFTVLEVQDSAQAISAVTAWSEIQKIRNGIERIVILLDNMGPMECGKADEELRKIGLREWCILEGSGGVRRVDLQTWVDISGVDVISSSEVNMGSQQLDISMLIGDV